MRWVFLSDIDGTLLRRDAPLTREVKAAADAYTGCGGLLSLCTGRSLPAVRQTAAALGVNAPCIVYGGAAIYDFQQECFLYSRPFSWDVMPSVRSVLKEYPDVSMQVFTPERVFILRRNPRLDALGVQEENAGPLSPPEAVTGAVLKLVMCCEEPSQLERCRRFFPPEACNFAFASRTFVDIVPAGFGKGEAVAQLSRLLDIPTSRFFGAGDAITDLPMLRSCAISFAPENALEPVKTAVTHVIPDVRAGGMAAAFRMAAARLKANPPSPVQTKSDTAQKIHIS